MVPDGVREEGLPPSPGRGESVRMTTTNGHRPSPSLPPVDWAQPHDEAVVQLERQLVRGSHFAQAALDKLQARIARAEASLGELYGLLEAIGLLAEEVEEEVESADADAAVSAEENGDESSTTRPVNWPGVAFRTEPTDLAEAPTVDCAARMHICHAVCCKLGFALTPPEVEAGKAKWDLGFPYMIRHESNGYCSHNDTATGRCGIYADRPGVCRRYSCENDTRIWKDFEAMELNEEWIRENLQNRSRILVRPSLPIMEVNGVPTTG